MTAPSSRRALAGSVARGYASARLPEERSRELPALTPPAWVFLRMRPHPASATAIRAQRPIPPP